MILNIDRILDSRKDDLRRIKPGAVEPEDPKIIWVKMINRVNVYN